MPERSSPKLMIQSINRYLLDVLSMFHRYQQLSLRDIRSLQLVGLLRSVIVVVDTGIHIVQLVKAEYNMSPLCYASFSYLSVLY